MGFSTFHHLISFSQQPCDYYHMSSNLRSSVGHSTISCNNKKVLKNQNPCQVSLSDSISYKMHPYQMKNLWCYSHFIDLEMEAQRHEMASPGHIAITGLTCDWLVRGSLYNCTSKHHDLMVRFGVWFWGFFVFSCYLKRILI